MAEIIKWTADTPAFWILLEILETALYFYLVCGLLPNIRNMGRKEKIIRYTVFAVTVFLSGMKYRIGSAFSSLAFFTESFSLYWVPGSLTGKTCC